MVARPASNLRLAGARAGWKRDVPGGNQCVGNLGTAWNLNCPPADPHVWVPWGLYINASGNGWIYLHGHTLGRYWEAGPQRKFFLPACWLNFGPKAKNNVTLCLRHTDHTAQLWTRPMLLHTRNSPSEGRFEFACFLSFTNWTNENP